MRASVDPTAPTLASTRRWTRTAYAVVLLEAGSLGWAALMPAIPLPAWAVLARRLALVTIALSMTSLALAAKRLHAPRPGARLMARDAIHGYGLAGIFASGLLLLLQLPL